MAYFIHRPDVPGYTATTKGNNTMNTLARIFTKWLTRKHAENSVLPAKTYRLLWIDDKGRRREQTTSNGVRAELAYQSAVRAGVPCVLFEDDNVLYAHSAYMF